MKKYLFFISCFITISAMAQHSGNVNGLNYSWGNGKATVEKQSKKIMNYTANILESITDDEGNGEICIVDSIVDSAFSNSNLTYFTMPNTINKISNSCFYMCENFQYAILPDNVISFGNKSFYGCKKLRNINLPSSLEIIGDSCFADCYYYNKDVKLEKNIKEIGKACFANCKYIPSVKINARIDTLKENVFYGCSKLSTFTWPKQIKKVESGCFAGCSSLKEIHLPYTIETLSDSCFANCTSLSKVYCMWKDLDKITVSIDAFNNISPSAVLYVPKGSISVYKNKSPWSIFSKIEEYEFTDVSKVESIDLGLGVKWASCNIGVSKSSGYGDKLAWGELYPKEYYNWRTYDYCKDGNYDGGITDIGSDISKTEYDVAHELWGDNWRMPTIKEARELVDNCNWEWIDNEGISGMKITGYNGNSIFLPSDNIDSNSSSYWTSTEGEYKRYAGALNFNNQDYIGPLFSDKYLGMFIRPVTSHNIQKNYLSINVTGSGNVVLGKVSVHNGEKHFYVDKNYKSILNFHPDLNEWVLKLYVNGKDVTENINNEQYILLNNSDSTYVRIVFSNSNIPSDAIDLGLSVLWANRNIGAEAPEKMGTWIPWGATQQAPNGWSDYLCEDYLCGGDLDPIYAAGFFKNKDIAGSAFDQAHVLLGSGWQLPSDDQFNELIDKCEWNRENISGTNGYRITGPNGNSIFLPENGYLMPGGRGVYSNNCYYWSSTLHSKTEGGTLCVLLPDAKYITSNVRCYNQNIRPIFKQTKVNTGIKIKEQSIDNDFEESYYNIYGIKVNEPANGLYIVKTSNGKYRKIIKGKAK